MPSFSLPEPEVSYSNDLYFFKDFENEFPAIVYNDALTSKFDFSTEPTLCPQHIDEFNLKDETSLSECCEKEQKVLYFNDLFPFNVNMDDPNITIEEYIRLEEEKAHRNGKVYNWETATCGKIWYNEDVHGLKSVETEFLTIVFNDAFTSDVTPSYELTISLLNDNKTDFRISFDESDDKDYTPAVTF
nr:hypothetical protein [Tanacetum cinerariifolium]